MLDSLTEEPVLKAHQLMMVHSKVLRQLARPMLPRGWTPGDFKTVGVLDAQRVKLETLGNRMFRLKILSFACKIVSVITLNYTRDILRIDATQHSVMFSVTVLAVQVVPVSGTLLLFYRHIFGRDEESVNTDLSMANCRRLSNDVAELVAESVAANAEEPKTGCAAGEDDARHQSMMKLSRQAESIIGQNASNMTMNAAVAAQVAACVEECESLTNVQQSNSAEVEGVIALSMKRVRRYFVSSSSERVTAVPLLQAGTSN